MALFELPIRVYWEDTDAGGIVYHANYLKFFERARTEWLRALGVNQQALRDQTGGVFVATRLDIRYLRPARLDDALTVTATCAATRRAALTIRQQAWRERSPAPAPERELLADGNVQIAWVDAETLKPKRIPADLLAKLRI